MKRMDTAVLVLCGVGFADSVYLLINAIFPSIPLRCPNAGVVNCIVVTTSPYSHIHGVPVALLAVLWFPAIAYLSLVRSSFSQYLLFPLWVAGIATVGYLVSVETFILHEYCLYCTLAHICAALLGLPAYRLSFSD